VQIAVAIAIRTGSRCFSAATAGTYYQVVERFFNVFGLFQMPYGGYQTNPSGASDSSQIAMVNREGIGDDR
jgi:hypothetical protein